MSALREWAASAGGAAHKVPLWSVKQHVFSRLSLQAVKVNSLGKWKTALQMVSMSVLLVARQPALVPLGFQGDASFSRPTGILTPPMLGYCSCRSNRLGQLRPDVDGNRHGCLVARQLHEQRVDALHLPSFKA